ncbi:LytR/AlgR family response regulator transcription factor [Pararhodonellum marinum]|uniref:LytR/AlgR family response regulator transcription factor n=1 Tax=Pararhodonellum marinum TaxID=2755358 RepID=UPI00188E3FF7|nr:LytTR family DNA-binding domain-containing protein [Pararhodonellum marinum]
MPENFLQLWRQPYPYYSKGRNLWYLALIIFAMSLFFNYLFEPFVVYTPEHRMNYFWISTVHSGNAFLVVLIVLLIQNGRVDEDRWTVGKEITLIALIFLLIGISQFLVRDLIYDNPDNWSWKYFLEEIRNTFLVGTLFVIILVPLNYLRLVKRHLKSAQLIQPFSLGGKETKEGSIIPILTQQKTDDFNLDPSSFLFAKADGNYLEIFVENGTKPTKLIKRMTLKDLEQQLDSFPQFFKTHRSYLVNLQKVVQVKGNAQGYVLEIQDDTEAVPVSRGMIKQFEKQFSH